MPIEKKNYEPTQTAWQEPTNQGRGVLGSLMFEKLAAPYSPPSLQWQNGTILGWLCHRWITCLNPGTWGWTRCYKWHIVHPEGGVDIMLVDIVKGCQTDQRTKCSGGRTVWWMFHEGKNIQWTLTFCQGTEAKKLIGDFWVFATKKSQKLWTYML